jgi:hypothetical protein
MMKTTIFVLLAFSLVMSGCSKNAEPPQQEQSTQPVPAPSSSHEPAQPAAPTPALSTAPSGGMGATIAGIQWTVPQSWTPQPERPMRVATYSIPAAAAAEGGECAVFFFGSGQGGDVRSNIDRWVGQFKTESKPEESTRTVNGINVTTVKVAGTYLAPSGPMMQSSGEKPGYLLIGTIVEAPEGAVFFKATGPAATMNAAEADIKALVDSVKKVN